MGDDAEYYMECQRREAFQRQNIINRNYYFYEDDYDEYYDDDYEETTYRKQNLVVLIDAENVSYRYMEQIYDEIMEMGELFEARYYAMQNDPRTRAWIDVAKEYDIKQILLFGEPHKNKVDNKIIKDAKSILRKHKNVDIFCIVSKDGDYTELVNYLREHRKRVEILAPEGISRKLIDASSYAIELDDDY